VTPEQAKFYAGQLRWSNRHIGVEFAPLDSEVGGDSRSLPRRQANGVAGTPGMLLQDEVERDGYGEGCGVIVIALPRRMRDEEIQAARDKIESVIRTDASDEIAQIGLSLARKAIGG
jgi:hypothetical protein